MHSPLYMVFILCILRYTWVLYYAFSVIHGFYIMHSPLYMGFILCILRYTWVLYYAFSVIHGFYIMHSPLYMGLFSRVYLYINGYSWCGSLSVILSALLMLVYLCYVYVIYNGF